MIVIRILKKDSNSSFDAVTINEMFLSALLSHMEILSFVMPCCKNTSLNLIRPDKKDNYPRMDKLNHYQDGKI